MKRLFDVVFASILLITLSPLLLFIAIVIKLTSKGPVFFSQKRVGRYCEEFDLYKFRTMCVGAEDQQAAFLDQNERSGPAFKMVNDPRVTPVGRFLRKHSLDELPQLLNIIKGDMSFVGPRPNLPYEVAQYNPWYFRRLGTLPGLTCYWQIASNRNMPFHQWMTLDIWYVDHVSMWTDIKLIWKTIPIVLRGHT